MSSFKNSTNTPLNCFASAIKLVIQAVMINFHIVPLAKEIAVSFASVVKDPSSTIPVMSELQTGSNQVKEILVIQTTNSRDCILFLVEAICIPLIPNVS